MLKAHIFKQQQKNQQAHTTETHGEPALKSCCWFCRSVEPLPAVPFAGPEHC